MGLFRKKTHDVVLIEEKEYEITEIMPIECYLFRVCMKKLVEAKTIKQFSIETRADGTINENKLISDLKEYMPESEATFDWLHNYKDLSNMPVTFHLLQRKVRVNATQLLILLMQDNNIIIREVYDEECIVGNLYVLTFASTVILYMLGIKPEYLNDKNVVISGSLQKTLISMCNEIIDENNNETVSSIGIVDNHLFMNIVTEQEKVTIMREAPNLKQFALGFNKLDNFKDVEWEIADKINLLEILGIADYDALAIAQVKKAIVVTGEVLTMRLIQIKELGVNGTGIINFLIGIQMEIDDLLDCMKKMVGFRLLITLTKDSVIYLMERYNEIEEDDEKEQCMEKWIDYLSMPENMNEEYKDAFVQNLTEVYRRMYEQQRENVNPIWSNFVFFLMKYNHIKLKVSIEKDGNIEVAVHRDLE